ncbi:hypothetical protein [Bailinhaonella thermotolerans]|uniref:Uncharacterized protein n=1 Tax=Bailinhaonella thermotolerans TaxID=1070861 RepID=A0A3A4ANA8_9ACTN|nr:hypothetical protein [Bailinhaonella thermotolerans]RJL29945.1 hypothetical protein D5H75_23620 [Bailinhaonella thermotolerans]
MSKKNVATSGTTAIQVGQVLGSSKKDKPASPEKSDRKSTVTNVRIGNAKVGRQADTITGGIQL